MLMLQLRGVMVGLLGIFNIGSWDGRDFYGVGTWGLWEIFFTFFSISRICKAGFRNVHNCARVPGTEVLYVLYWNARLINPASRNFFYITFQVIFLQRNENTVKEKILQTKHKIIHKNTANDMVPIFKTFWIDRERDHHFSIALVDLTMQ